MQDNMVNADAATGAESTATESQATNSSVKTFTQDEVNKIIAARLAKVENKYAEVDVEEYRSFKSAKAKQEEDALLKRNEFDKVLNQTKDHYSSQVNRLKQELEAIKVDGAIVSAASQLKVVAPDHVAKLLKTSVRLSEDGGVEVLDDKGQVRYNPASASPLTVDELVKEFVSKNPFYQAPGPVGSGSRNNLSAEQTKKINVADLDMKNPEHRKVYAEYRKSAGLA
jgi:hypothetical protein